LRVDRHLGILGRNTAVFFLCALAGNAATDADLLHALRAGTTSRIPSLIASGASVEAEDSFGRRALTYAVLCSDVATVRLLLDKGADPNHADRAGTTALMMAVSDIDKVGALVSHGANVNAIAGLTGRSALLIACARPGNAHVVRYLLDQGADPNIIDTVDSFDHREKTPLLAAAASGDPGIVQALLDRGVNVNQQTGAFTPLLLAAVTGSRATVDILLANGAIPGKSPVLLPAVTDRTMFRALLDKGADPHAQGILGLDALLFAAADDHADPEVVRLLLTSGFDPTAGHENLHLAHGYGNRPESALDWARRQGNTPVTQLLANSAAHASTAEVTRREPDPPRRNATLRAAVRSALPLLATAGREFFKRSGCVSCHSNMLPEIAAAAAKKAGLSVQEGADRNRQQSVAYLEGHLATLLHGVPLSGTDSTIAYLLWGLSSDNYSRDDLTDTAVSLAVSQRLEGWWRVIPGRPPIEARVSATAIAIRALTSYPLPGHERDFQDRIRRAATWLASYAPRTGEERAMRLLGLRWARAASSTIKAAATQVLAKQRSDGGWAQLDTLQSDAYATGQALYALHVAGILPQHVREKGVRSCSTPRWATDRGTCRAARIPYRQTTSTQASPTDVTSGSRRPQPAGHVSP
jgi:ankyrin repeat protein